MRDTLIPEKLTKINLLASTVVTQVNAQHAKGMGLGVYATMTTGTDFFDTQRSITTLQATGLGDVLTAGSITIGSTQINVNPSTRRHRLMTRLDALSSPTRRLGHRQSVQTVTAATSCRLLACAGVPRRAVAR
ncbi:MAG: hypothetical protein EBU40_03250 [Proteobacteria bacterium]|nr:hypothetical protein [Pseudomonadota bacterium]